MSNNAAFPVEPRKTPSSFLDMFTPVGEEDVKKVIVSSPTKSCSQDPWPTFLVKQYLDILIVPITKIVNLSLATGEFPSKFRTAVVTPLHKKPSLPREGLSNYRPVSGLSFISKVIEKPSLPREGLSNYRPVSGLSFISKVIERIVAIQLNKHIVKNDLENAYQSAYRTGHSTETALLKLKNDIQLNLAENKATAVILLTCPLPLIQLISCLWLTDWQLGLGYVLLL